LKDWLVFDPRDWGGHLQIEINMVTSTTGAAFRRARASSPLGRMLAKKSIVSFRV